MLKKTNKTYRLPVHCAKSQEKKKHFSVNTNNASQSIIKLHLISDLLSLP